MATNFNSPGKKIFFITILSLYFLFPLPAQTDARFNCGNAKSIIAEGKYDMDGKPHGEWKYHYESGKLAYAGSFNHGLKDGEWIDYWENGNVSYKKTYNQNQLTGKSFSYAVNGIKITEENYCQGKPCGTWFNYHEENGSVDRKIIIDSLSNDSLPYIYCYEANRLFYFEGFCEPFGDVNKSKQGIFYEYDKHTRLEQKKIVHDSVEERIGYYKSGEVEYDDMYANGVMNGTSKVYYTNGMLHMESIYLHGEVNGKYKEYYKNGQIKIDFIFSNHELNLSGTIYKRNGDVKSHEVAENGKFIKLK